MMADELDEVQLMEFCDKLGIAKDGYLDEKELSIVFNCISLQVPNEMMKELFEELDGDKDGKVCLAELSQMLRGMHSIKTASPEKLKKPENEFVQAGSLGAIGLHSPSDFCMLPVSERGIFTILDPHNTGFGEIGAVLDLWGQIGITQESGIDILKDLGYSSTSRSSSINLHELSKSIEEEADTLKDSRISTLLHAALITYKTEAQYLRSLCESVECERDKLKSDIYEAHQRSTVLAQEVDEQNSRLERNSKLLLQKLDAKYNEQIQELQERFSSEKDSIQQALSAAEFQLASLREEDIRLKTQIMNLNNENATLEKEVQSLNEEVRVVTRHKEQLEREMSRYIDLENKFHDMEKRSQEKVATYDRKLKKAYIELQGVRDQNDELNAQMEGLRETLKIVRNNEEKRYYMKRRKGTSAKVKIENTWEESSGIPMEKIGKFHGDFQLRMLESTADCDETESFIDPLNSSSCSQPDSGTFPNPNNSSLSGCTGESSGEINPTPLPSLPHEPKCTELEEKYKSLENEMDSVKERIVTIISEKKILQEENGTLRMHLERLGSQGFLATRRHSLPSTSNSSSSATQTEIINESTDPIIELEKATDETRIESASEEMAELRRINGELESALDLLRSEYEKCEDYWHNKLQEERESYEEDRNESDLKFQELADKIKEYEQLVLEQEDEEKLDRLPVIEERVSLERQVTDLEDECHHLKIELNSAKEEQQSLLHTYQKNWENKLMDECGQLEQQVSALTKKCQEYENRLSSLAEEEAERSTLQDQGMIHLWEEKVAFMEGQLSSQEERYKQHISRLERNLKEKDEFYMKKLQSQEIGRVSSPPSVGVHHHQQQQQQQQQQLRQESGNIVGANRLFDVYNGSQYTLWPPGRPNEKSASLPFIPAEPMQQYPSHQAVQPPPQWAQGQVQNEIYPLPPPVASKKAWCHVELGWLQALRAKLKHRDEQCYLLQRTLQQKEMHYEKRLAEVKFHHEAEISNWESLMQASQELVRQQTVKQKEQSEKLAQADLLMKDLWMENAKLMAALSATEQRVIQLENLLKFQMSAGGHHGHGRGQSGGPPHSLHHNFT